MNKMHFVCSWKLSCNLRWWQRKINVVTQIFCLITESDWPDVKKKKAKQNKTLHSWANVYFIKENLCFGGLQVEFVTIPLLDFHKPQENH